MTTRTPPADPCATCPAYAHLERMGIKMDTFDRVGWRLLAIPTLASPPSSIP